MSDLRAPSVLEEMLLLWSIASASERVRFLAAVTSGPRHDPDARYPEHGKEER